MNPNLPLDKQNIDDVDMDLHIEAGLIDGGIDEDGNIMWLGTRKQWNDYESLSKNYES